MNMRIAIAGLAVAFIAGVAGSASANPTTTTVAAGALGNIMANTAGMTLYTYDRDTVGTSNCIDACATNWPPFMAGAADTATGDWTLIVRAGGTAKQWAYKGKPVYAYAKDTKKGDAVGDAPTGVWHVIK